MTTVALMVMMQVLNPATSFVVSTKAGLVNYVQGSATVKAATSIPAGQPVGTGPGGAVEILLNPGSYLRMGENSTVVLDATELTDIALRILQGSAVIEASGVDKELPIKVTSGNLKMDIIKDGIYMFADGKVVVVDGKIRDSSNGLVYGKGYQISDDQGYRAQKVKTFTTSLELWSQKRDELIDRGIHPIVNISQRIKDTASIDAVNIADRIQLLIHDSRIDYFGCPIHYGRQLAVAADCRMHSPGERERIRVVLILRPRVRERVVNHQTRVCLKENFVAIHAS